MAGGEWWRVDGPWRVLGRSTGETDAESVYAPEVPVEPAAEAQAQAQAPVAAGAVGLSAADFPGWDSVSFDFPVVEAEVPAEPEPVVPEQREPEAEAAVGPKASVLAGRRPSALVLFAALVLLAGAAIGQVPVLLVGWALTYLAPRLGDFTRKFAVLGIPLATMTAATVWRGGQLGQGGWGAAVEVLRVAGAASAVFVLAVTLRRRQAD